MRRDVAADRCAGMVVWLSSDLRVHVDRVVVRAMGVEVHYWDEDGCEMVAIVPPRTRLAVA